VRDIASFFGEDEMTALESSLRDAGAPLLHVTAIKAAVAALGAKHATARREAQRQLGRRGGVPTRTLMAAGVLLGFVGFLLFVHREEVEFSIVRRMTPPPVLTDKPHAIRPGRMSTANSRTKHGRAKTGMAKNGRAKNGRAKNGRAKNGRAKNGRAKNGRASCRELAFEELASMTNGATVRPSRESQPAFSWEDINTGSNATCGMTKCYFPSATANCTGYLISGNDAHDPPLSWLYARCLASRYGIKHLLRAPEERINVSTQMAYYLGSVHRAHYNLHLTTKALLGVHSGDQLLVQKVKTAPPGLLVGCVGNKWHNALAALASFASTVTSAHAVGHLNASLESTRQLLLKERCLTGDLQFIISSGGDVIHIDLDRALACKQMHRLRSRSATIDRCFRVLVNRLAALVQPRLAPSTEPRGAL
jgi:hypothetical protein